MWLHDASPRHIQEAIEGSLKRLRLECIDVYQVHVPDPAINFDATVEAFALLREQGKVRHIGLSNVTLEHLHRAEKIVPIVCVQNRYNLNDREWDPVLDHCQSQGIPFIPWTPIAQARKPGEVVEKIAADRGVSTVVVLLAWLLRRSPVMLPIPGTGNVKHLEENISAAAFHLTDTEFDELSAAVPKANSLHG
jgi:pyridoxine 4-dehydrogenase